VLRASARKNAALAALERERLRRTLDEEEREKLRQLKGENIQVTVTYWVMYFRR